jgi:hypothetical protein
MDRVKSLKTNEVWELTTLSRKRAVGSKWVSNVMVEMELWRGIRPDWWHKDLIS